MTAPIIIHGGPMGRWEANARNHLASQQRQAQPRTVGLSGLNLGESFTASRNRIPGVHDAHQSRCVGMILAGPPSRLHRSKSFPDALASCLHWTTGATHGAGNITQPLGYFTQGGAGV